jgi:hypothetical protein
LRRINTPSNGRGNRGLSFIAATKAKEVGEAGHVLIQRQVVDEAPSFLSVAAGQEEVINVFVQEGQAAESASPCRNRLALVGRRRRFASQQKILHFKGAALCQTDVASSSIGKCLKFKE